MSNIRKLALDAINSTGGTQSRAELNQATVSEYAEALSHGAEFPPVIVFSDGAAGGNWLADGFHRYHAHRAAGLVEITCDVRVGTLRDAKLFSSGANGTHGLPRTNADKRSAVLMVLEDTECAVWSDRQIARHCRVSNNFVGDVRRAVCHPMTDAPSPVRVIQRGDATYELNTAKIGKPSAPAPAAAATPPAVSPTPMHTAAPAAAHDNADAPDFGATQAPSPTQAAPTEEAMPLEYSEELDDARMPTPMELLVAAQRKVDERDQEIFALRARIELLEQGDLAAQIVVLELDRDGIRNRAADYFEKLATANNKVIDYKKRLDRLRKLAGVATDADLIEWVRGAARSAA